MVAQIWHYDIKNNSGLAIVRTQGKYQISLSAYFNNLVNIFVQKQKINDFYQENGDVFCEHTTSLYN